MLQLDRRYFQLSSAPEGRIVAVVLSDSLEAFLLKEPYTIAFLVSSSHPLVKPACQCRVPWYYLLLKQMLQGADLPIIDYIHDAQLGTKVFLIVLLELRVHILQKFCDGFEL